MVTELPVSVFNKVASLLDFHEFVSSSTLLVKVSWMSVVRLAI